MPTCLALGMRVAVPRPSSGSVTDEQDHSAILYEDVVRPSCEQLNLTPLRAEDLTNAGLPVDQLLRLVAEVDIVVVDLSGTDEELSFGLGVRHALGRRTIHFTDGTAIPPGSDASPSIELPRHAADPAAARNQLTALLAEALCGASSKSSAAGPTTEAGRTRPDGHDDAPGLFDLVAEAEVQMEGMMADIADVESAMADFGAMMELMAEDMARVSNPGASMSAKLTVVTHTAKAINGPVGELESATERFAQRMSVATVAFDAFMEWAESTPRSEWPDGLVQVLEQMAESPCGIGAAAFQEAMTLIHTFGASSRHLRVPARRIGTSCQTLFQSFAGLEERRTRAVRLLPG
ncbi:hypothetical protein ACWEFL_20440 [Streptomyces sp. NPDC004838]